MDDDSHVQGNVRGVCNAAEIPFRFERTPTVTPADWWNDIEGELPTDFLMRHDFSGDPWGLCSRCDHPVYHRIHRVQDTA